MLKANKELEKIFMISSLVINTRTENQYNKLMKWADSKKIPWYGNEKASSENNKGNWNRYKEKTCIRCTNGRCLTFGDVEFFKGLSMPVVTYRQFFKQQKPEEPEKTGFEVGDLVKVREDLKILKEYDGFSIFPDMAPYRGKKTVITKMSYGGSFKIDCDEGDWNWSPSMLELVKKHEQKKQPIEEKPMTLEELNNRAAHAIESAFKKLITIPQLEREAHENALKHGFWDDWQLARENGRNNDCNAYVSQFLMLIVSEVSEALQALRKKDLVNFREELSDVVIRSLDLAGGLHIDLQSEIIKKMEKNKSREYKHGKAF